MAQARIVIFNSGNDEAFGHQISCFQDELLPKCFTPTFLGLLEIIVRILPYDAPYSISYSSPKSVAKSLDAEILVL